MCEFLSFKIERTADGLQIRTSKSLDDHNDIPGDGYEGEWHKDEKLDIRVAPGTSDNVADELAAFVKKTYKTQQKMADKLIMQYLKDGVLPGHFWEYSKLDDRKLRLFACYCAERVLPLFEKQYPNDNRPRHAIEVARLFADGKATNEERDAARDAAWDAAWDAAGDAVWDAAWAAAWDAAWDAAGAAAFAAAGDAAKAAELLARVKFCKGLKLSVKHKRHALERWQVWKKGYGCAYDVNGKLFCYKKP